MTKSIRGDTIWSSTAPGAANPSDASDSRNIFQISPCQHGNRIIFVFVSFGHSGNVPITTGQAYKPWRPPRHVLFLTRTWKDEVFAILHRSFYHKLSSTTDDSNACITATRSLNPWSTWALRPVWAHEHKWASGFIAKVPNYFLWNWIVGADLRFCWHLKFTRSKCGEPLL